MEKIVLIDPNELRAHEAISIVQARRVLDDIRKSGYFYPPVLVDRKTRVVLDGHHRLWASRELGCKRIPCYCVDYLVDEDIVLQSWRPEVSLTKEQVIEMGLSGGTFPEKTTRHIYTMPDSAARVPLSELLA